MGFLDEINAIADELEVEANPSLAEISPMAKKVIDELNKGKSVFLTGAGGTGKSYLTREIISAYKENEVAVLASTGIAAVNIGGQTTHSFFRFGISDNLDELKANDKHSVEWYKSTFKVNDKAAYKMLAKSFTKKLKGIKLVVIDEVSMLNKNLIDMIFYRFDMARCYPPVLFVGDFFQLPPVKSYGFAYESPYFQECKFFMLTKPKRQKDMNFVSLLNAIRIGERSELVINELVDLQVDLPSDFNGSYLVSTNREAELINDKKLSQLPTPFYKSVADVIYAKTERDLSKFWNETQAPQVLRFKVGAVVMFITNEPRAGYMNGELGVIKQIKDKKVLIEKLSNGDLIEINGKSSFTKYEFVPAPDGDGLEKHILVQVEQLPFKIAFSSTIHKTQGLTLDKIYVNADKIFTEAQLYVALSRATTREGVILHNFEPAHIKANPEVLDFYQNSDFELLD